MASNEKVPYINYKDLEEFYSIQEACKLLKLSKDILKRKCNQYGIEPRRNEIGEYGFVKYDIRKLHNFLYQENRDGTKADDPWAGEMNCLPCRRLQIS